MQYEWDECIGFMLAYASAYAHNALQLSISVIISKLTALLASIYNSACYDSRHTHCSTQQVANASKKRTVPPLPMKVR